MYELYTPDGWPTNTIGEMNSILGIKALSYSPVNTASIGVVLVGPPIVITPHPTGSLCT